MKAKEYQGLHNLVAPEGARRNTKRVGRGESSGHGKTSGRGHKGQKARKSGNVRIGFEGGQNPMARRLPKRGFSNYPFRKEVQSVNLSSLVKHFAEGAVVDRQSLMAVGLISGKRQNIKVLGRGEIDFPLTLKVNAVSKSVMEKVQAKGGVVELI